MQRVTVTVKRHGEPQVTDLEVDADMPVAELVPAIAAALGWGNDASAELPVYDVEIHPAGEMIGQYQTLAEARVWDGTLLIFHPRTAPVEVVPESPTPSEGPVVRWLPLDIP